MARSASPSKAAPKCRAVRHHGLLQAFQVQRAAVQIDVAAVGRAADGDHVGAQRAEQFRRQAVGRAVAAIERDLHAVQPQRRGRQQEIEILPGQRPLPPKASAARA